jgi:hypothetical protein
MVFPKVRSHRNPKLKIKKTLIKFGYPEYNYAPGLAIRSVPNELVTGPPTGGGHPFAALTRAWGLYSAMSLQFVPFDL